MKIISNSRVICKINSRRCAFTRLRARPRGTVPIPAGTMTIPAVTATVPAGTVLVAKAYRK